MSDRSRFKRVKKDDELEFCNLSLASYATINGVRTNARTRQKKSVQVHWLCSLSEGRPVFRILDGVTGFESWLVSSLLGTFYRNREKKEFAACLGCDRWDRLVLDVDEVRAVLEKLVELYRIEVER